MIGGRRQVDRELVASTQVPGKAEKSKTAGAHSTAEKPAAEALQATFKRGFALHQEGKLADAERIYDEVLRRQPDHFDALHMLGVVAYQTGRAARAVELINRAIERNANVASAYS